MTPDLPSRRAITDARPWTSTSGDSAACCFVTPELLTGRAGEPSDAELERATVAFVPLGTPLLAGPGAIVATMLFVQRVHGVRDGFALAGAMAAVALTVWLAMRLTLAIHQQRAGPDRAGPDSARPDRARA